jgi:hypothetical protein
LFAAGTTFPSWAITAPLLLVTEPTFGAPWAASGKIMMGNARTIARREAKFMGFS